MPAGVGYFLAQVDGPAKQIIITIVIITTQNEYIILCFVVLCCVVLCYIILYYIILYYIILYYIILYYLSYHFVR